MRERSAAHLLPVVQEAHVALFGVPADPPPVVTWFAYVGTKSTIRERDGRLRIRFSDHLASAPEVALRGLAGVLLCRLRGLPEARVAAADRDAYQQAIAAEAVEERRSSSRRRRGRKQLQPVGDHRSLLESYLRVSMTTGLVLPEPPRLSWSPTRSRRRFGHHDPDHDCIVLSRVLDDPQVPEFVLDFVVYHELLHIVHPPVQGRGRKRIVHHKAFRAAEARFPERDEAEVWLTRLARRS